jgi:TonB-dependent starch-binding outer membrane protein SusC
MRKLRWLLSFGLAIALLPQMGFAQERGVISGSVVDQATQRPLIGAQVTVAGTQLGTITNQQGRFTITGVPAGIREVRASLIGFSAATRTVEVAPGAVATVELALAQTAVALDELVVTGTAGRQERRAQAAVVETLNAAEIVQNAPVTNIGDILTARTPGVSVLTTSGTTGANQQIRLRGAASLTLSNEPLVFIDGVRADARQVQTYGTGGQAGSRLNDIRPEDIESIEIVKGPAAATLYGADASAGVIQIITKRGRVGSGFTQSITTEYNQIDANWTPPSNFWTCSVAWTTLTNAAGEPTVPMCFGRAADDLIISDNPLQRYNVFRTGTHRALNWSGRGGGENYGFYVSLGVDQEDGTLPNNEFDRMSGRFNFNFIPTENLRLEAGLGLIHTDRRMPQNDNNIYGYLGGGLLGDAWTAGRQHLGDNRDGWFAANRQVEAISAIDNADVTLRTIPTLTVNYSPLAGFTNRLTLGADITRTEAHQLWPLNEQGWYGTATLNSGQIGQARINRDQLTLDYLGNFAHALAQNISSDISFGTQLISRRTDTTDATGQGLPTRTTTAVNAAATLLGGQTMSEERSAGVFGQWQVGFNDRLFVQAAGRWDVHSAFGTSPDPFFSPKLGVSYVLSDEPFWQNIAPALISTLRLRGAFGTTGRSPTTGIQGTFTPSPFAISPTDVRGGLVFGRLGNPDLRPERGTELEVGFDAGFFQERLGVELSYFNKVSRDVILSRPLPPSAGFAQNPLFNVGEMVNRGLEVALNARLLETAAFGWDARVAFNTLHHEITDMGDVTPFGTRQRFAPGYQAGAYFAHRVVGYERNDAGEPTRAIVSDTLEFVGNNLPTFEGSFTNTFSIARNIRLSGQLDWKRGFMLYNNTAQFRDRSWQNSEAWHRRNDPDFMTAEESRSRYGPFVSTEGRAIGVTSVDDAYIESGDFVRLREVALTYSLPRGVASRFGGTGASVTLAGRNLGLWTDYTGEDPEVQGISFDDFARWDFLTMPQARRWVARVNFQF